MAGAQAPEVDGELAGERDDGFLARGAGGEGAFGQDLVPLLERAVVRLEADEAPGGFDEGGADPRVAVLGDAPLEPGLAGAIFARAEAGVTADLAPVREAPPIADLAVEEDAGEGTEPAGLGRVGRGL